MIFTSACVLCIMPKICFRTSSSSSLVKKAIDIAQRNAGQPSESPVKLSRVLPAATVSDVGAAISFVASFNEGTTLQSEPVTRLPYLVSSSLCNILPSINYGLVNTHNRTHTSSHRLKFEQHSGGVKIKERIRDLQSSKVTVADLVSLVRMSKRDGRKLSIESYSELLKLCFSVINTTTPTGTQTTRLHPSAGRLVRHMTEDCDIEEVKSAIYTTALQVSTSSAQVDSIYSQFVGTELETRVNRDLLVEAYLQTEVTPRPSLSRLLSQGGQPSPLTFERLIVACAHKYQLSRCVGVYLCMTRRYGMAPSRMVFSIVTRLLSETFEDDQTFHWKLGLTSQVLTDTVRAFDGHPPLWVYSEMAKPLALLLGSDGYNHMLEASGKAVQEYYRTQSGNQIADTMRSLWTPSLFRCLLECAQWTGNTSLALDLLSDMKLLYQNADSGEKVRWVATFRLLLEVFGTHEHLSIYLPVLIEEMTTILSPEQITTLRDSLLRALERAHSNKNKRSPVKPHLRSQDHTPLTPIPGYLSAAAHLLIDTAIQATSTDRCISDLANWANGYGRTEGTVVSDDLESALAI